VTAFRAVAGSSLFASLSPSFLPTLLPWHAPLLSGLAITSLLAVSVIGLFMAKAVAASQCLNIGLMMMGLSLMVLVLCMYSKISLLFFISDICFGIGHGFALMGAFALIHQMTSLDNRAAVMSTYLFIAYLGTIVPIIAVGYLADHWGLDFAVISFCIAISLLCFALWWAYQKSRLPV